MEKKKKKEGVNIDIGSLNSLDILYFLRTNYLHYRMDLDLV